MKNEQNSLTVSQLTDQIRGLLENNFRTVCVTGEVTGLSRPASGHLYFSLQDAKAKISAVMWRSTAKSVAEPPKEGAEVICTGELSLYAPRGSYQLVVKQVRPLGVGEKELALQRLTKKLQKEGLFDLDRKRPLPRLPRRIGVVTSPSGAAIQDFLNVLGRRWQGCDVLILPAKVQGAGSAAEIAEQIQTAQRIKPKLDLLVVTRGGGSADDLAAFNDENLVRAVAASKIPTISAVGHEIDTSLCDLVADLRALTPSEAAERAVPDAADVAEMLSGLEFQLNTALARRLTAARQWLESREQVLASWEPSRQIAQHTQTLDITSQRLEAALRGRLRNTEATITQMAGKLESLSPLAVLTRGYAVVQRTRDHATLRDPQQVQPGDELAIRLEKGNITAEVVEK